MQNSHQYWCFACERHFKAQKEASVCSLCQSLAIEEVEHNNDPANFRAYQIARQQPQLQTAHSQPTFPQIAPPIFNPFGFPHLNNAQGLVPPSPASQMNFFQMHLNLNNVFQTFQQLGRQNGIFNMLNSLMGQPHLVAASQQEISRLQKVDKVAGCSICQEEQNEQSNRGYKLQCGHSFHQGCLNPWLERTNTCPTCRSRI